MKNVAVELPPSITFRLKGTKSNRDAIGVTVGRQTRRVQAGSGFLSQHSKELAFGLGEFAGAVTATIRWPSGAVQMLRGLPVNHRVFVEEGTEVPRLAPTLPLTLTSNGIAGDDCDPAIPFRP